MLISPQGLQIWWHSCGIKKMLFVSPFMQAAMVRSLLEKQPSKRPSATEVFNGAQLKGLRKAVKKSKKSDLVPVF